MMMFSNLYAQSVSRRRMLKQAACGFGALALAGLAAEQSRAEQPANEANSLQPADDSDSPYRVKLPHHAPRAKRIIFIFMQGGPSQVDSFDPKPRLAEDDGKKVEFLVARTRMRTAERVMKSPWSFQQYGQCGQPVSQLFPEIAGCVDDLCLIRSMHTEGVAHGPATLFLHTGATNLIRPSMGAWVSYGLGTESQNLPAFVTINPPPTKGGPRNYGNSFLPTSYQGTVIGNSGNPSARIKHLTNPAETNSNQQRQLDLLRRLNQEQSQGHEDDDRLAATMQAYELAFRMQTHAPEVMNVANEPQSVLEMYGIGEKATDEFGRQCLLARRFAEAGVRYIQVSYSDLKDTPRWDQHSNIKEHATHALATDKPVAGLLKDLKQRGLLEDTIVWWGGEFGRTPYAQGNDGRDHNPNGFSIWLAGGGFKPGFAYGETDDYGYNAVIDKVHMHDLHATILHQLGLDHKKLTYRYAGRDFRLTDVYGRVVEDVIV